MSINPWSEEKLHWLEWGPDGYIIHTGERQRVGEAADHIRQMQGAVGSLIRGFGFDEGLEQLVDNLL